MPKLGLILILTTIIFGCQNNDTHIDIPIEDYFDEESQAYAFVIPNLKPVAGVGGIKAENCQVCHTAFYDEWAQTTHAAALSDIQFQAELAKAESPKWVCLNCHIPVQNQREMIVTHLTDGDILQPAGRPNPQFDPIFQQEAISCATCHVRSDETTGESYIIGPFGSEFAPHPIKKDKEFLHNMCQRCHNPQGEGLTRNLVCWFDTAEEVAEGIAQNNLEKRDCVDCHMPQIDRRLVESMPSLPIRPTRQHHWVGSGVPKSYDGYDSLLARGYYSGLKVGLSDIRQVNDSLQLTLTLKNESAAHYLPTADPERFILMQAFALNQKSDTLSVKKYRIGQTWQWNPAKKIGDNRIKQNESRLWIIRFANPNNTLDNIVVEAISVRLTSENAGHIMQSAGLNEVFLPNANQLVKELPEIYPYASYIYGAKIDLATNQLDILSDEALIRRSKAEQGKEGKRDY